MIKSILSYFLWSICLKMWQKVSNMYVDRFGQVDSMGVHFWRKIIHQIFKYMLGAELGFLGARMPIGQIVWKIAWNWNKFSPVRKKVSIGIWKTLLFWIIVFKNNHAKHSLSRSFTCPKMKSHLSIWYAISDFLVSIHNDFALFKLFQ